MLNQKDEVPVLTELTAENKFIDKYRTLWGVPDALVEVSALLPEAWKPYIVVYFDGILSLLQNRDKHHFLK